MESNTRTVPGSCLCSAVRIEVSLTSKFCAHCHCPDCRRAHGAAFVTWAGFQDAQVKVVAGDEKLVRHKTDTGATRSFCSNCGSTLFYEGPRWPGETHVALANLSGPIDREPGGHAYVDDRAP